MIHKIKITFQLNEKSTSRIITFEGDEDSINDFDIEVVADSLEKFVHQGMIIEDELIMKIIAKHWGENGFRTFESKRLFGLSIANESYQGDMLFHVTLHLLRRTFQFLYWNKIQKEFSISSYKS